MVAVLNEIAAIERDMAAAPRGEAQQKLSRSLNDTRLRLDMARERARRR
jgi:hypothetical protein